MYAGSERSPRAIVATCSARSASSVAASFHVTTWRIMMPPGERYEGAPGRRANRCASARRSGRRGSRRRTARAAARRRGSTAPTATTCGEPSGRAATTERMTSRASSQRWQPGLPIRVRSTWDTSQVVAAKQKAPEPEGTDALDQYSDEGNPRGSSTSCCDAGGASCEAACGASSSPYACGAS